VAPPTTQTHAGATAHHFCASSLFSCVPPRLQHGRKQWSSRRHRPLREPWGAEPSCAPRGTSRTRLERFFRRDSNRTVSTLVMVGKGQREGLVQHSHVESAHLYSSLQLGSDASGNVTPLVGAATTAHAQSNNVGKSICVAGTDRVRFPPRACSGHRPIGRHCSRGGRRRRVSDRRAAVRTPTPTHRGPAEGSSSTWCTRANGAETRELVGTAA